MAVRTSARREGRVMSGRIEGSRRHGQFDLRWSKRRLRAAATRPTRPSGGLEDAAGLDWEGFSARYLPEARRHDMEAISAYYAYSSADGRGGRPLTGTSALPLPEAA